MDFFTYFCSMEERKYIVYIHKNKINGKVYVGITSLKPILRWRNDGSGYKKCVRFKNAILKHGWENFEHIIIFRNISKELACKEEQLLIKRYRKKELCYNIANGGEGVGVVSESTKEKLRAYRGEKASMYNKKFSKESILKRVETRKRENSYLREMPWLEKYRHRKGKDSPLYGKKPSENTLKAHRKIVLQFSLTNNYITEYASIKEASLKIGISSPAILHCLKGITKKAGGYIWKYKEE